MAIMTLMFFLAKGYERHIPRAYINLAESMEAQYIEFMLDKMKSTVIKTSPNGPAMDYYESIMTKEQAKRLVRSNGNLGIKKMILDQIYPKQARRVIYKKKRSVYGKHR